jgi:hypothetical protein
MAVTKLQEGVAWEGNKNPKDFLGSVNGKTVMC